MSDRLVQTFIDFVRIPSESGNEEQFLSHLTQRFEDEFDADCTRDSYGNIIARIAGKNSGSSAPLLFGMHGDTVAPGTNINPVVEEGVVRTDGTTVLGADDKAGIAELFEALQRADCHPPLEVVITREEEQGVVGARNLDFSLLTAKQGFVLDMDALDAIVTGGPTKVNLDITVTGRAAHAGMEPEKGISAIRVAARAIARVPDGRIDDVTTANIGLISGGENRNSVPERVVVKTEVRSLDHEKCLDVVKRLRETFEEEAASSGASVDIQEASPYEAVNIPEGARVIEVAADAIREAGLEPHIHPIVGGTDATVYNGHGIETAVLGMGVRQEHTRDEHIYVEDMERAVGILVSVLRRFADES